MIIFQILTPGKSAEQKQGLKTELKMPVTITCELTAKELSAVGMKIDKKTGKVSVKGAHESAPKEIETPPGTRSIEIFKVPGLKQNQYEVRVAFIAGEKGERKYTFVSYPSNYRTDSSRGYGLSNTPTDLPAGKSARELEVKRRADWIDKTQEEEKSKKASTQQLEKDIKTELDALAAKFNVSLQFDNNANPWYIVNNSEGKEIGRAYARSRDPKFGNSNNPSPDILRMELEEVQALRQRLMPK